MFISSRMARTATEAMMTLELPPQNRLRLGNDLTAGFPLILQRLANPVLLALLRQIEPVFHFRVACCRTRMDGGCLWQTLAITGS